MNKSKIRIFKIIDEIDPLKHEPYNLSLNINTIINYIENDIFSYKREIIIIKNEENNQNN